MLSKEELEGEKIKMYASFTKGEFILSHLELYALIAEKEKEMGKLQEMVNALSDEDTAEYEKLENKIEKLKVLACEVAKDYPDSADWKDARGKLYEMANQALAELEE
jgi:hypothetical protein